MQGQIADLAPKLVVRLEHKVLRRGHNIDQRSDDELHALRKSLKKLRYGVEFLGPTFRAKWVKRYLRCCKKLLKQLGALNDAVVVLAMAKRLGGDRQPELVPAVAALAAWATARQDDARRCIRKDWHALKSQQRFQ
jgi:triphosphatase